jgi:predicted LPLAT superfamily acyltransferase
MAPQSQLKLVDAGDFGVAAAMRLSAAVEAGEWVVIMGDRLPASRTAQEEGGVVAVEFLGERARLPRGPFATAAALRCPIYFLACYRSGGCHWAHFSTLSGAGGLGGSGRGREKLGALAQVYARTLEKLVLAAPLQWFNFYDFWALPEGGGGDERGR